MKVQPMSSKCYARERVEELRSRISLLKSTVTSLKQNYWNIFKKCTSSKHSPPYLFPTSTFNRLEETLAQFSLEVNPDYEQYTLVLRLNEIDFLCRAILVEQDKLQDALNQRICGLGSMKLLEYQPVLQVESGMLQKVYCAIDAVVFDLIKTILGTDWMQEEKYVPISLLNSQTGGYTVHPVSLLFSAPYHDSFRARFWPALSHEVSHILFLRLSKIPGSFLANVLRGCNELQNILSPYAPTDLQLINAQISELTSDIISCYVCPPSYLSAAINLAIPVDVPNSPPLHQVYPRHTHPPLDPRLAAMEVVLDSTGILDASGLVKKMVEGVNSFLSRKNLALPNADSYQLISNYIEFAIRYAQRILPLLHQIGLNAFDGDQWNTCVDSFFNQQYDLSPTQFLCVDWVKRLRQIKNDCTLSLQDFFGERKREPKIFEHMVHNLYNCYEDMVKQIREEGIFDIRFDLD